MTILYWSNKKWKTNFLYEKISNRQVSSWSEGQSFSSIQFQISCWIFGLELRKWFIDISCTRKNTNYQVLIFDMSWQFVIDVYAGLSMITRGESYQPRAHELNFSSFFVALVACKYMCSFLLQLKRKAVLL